ncbi:conserved hypothetical protein [Methylorubrum populi BJ001]|jgi:hypothetical protein|uniref:Uncharacterized protein n=1 Tax=Methylorubrum populi (strain ATCC BAA-705 / NCIMB 13946 / BJ001) TaxID=441620 RepID=B1Z880_METPB|nr:hypothetical protein [Methylorubrum populi]ACB80400.1 conserved hypothetical protein [Methylorubrum populi BJ001]OAH37464.1 hypothetical protein AX289_11770 [Methylorubrum populi]PZP70779.1 MAG: hypothetical protein DI590_09150 [Methylorubrum populi]
MRRFSALFLAMALVPGAASALSMTDTLEAWKQSSAMDRLQLATRFGKSFVSVNESFTAGYFVKCIDDVAGYPNAQNAKIEDAMRECVASQLRMTGKGQADD